MQNLLIQRFKDTFNEPPKWAWPFNPPVPLVGKNYKPVKCLLIYASAENLTWLNANTPPARFKGNKAWNRYRIQYEACGHNSKEFFPDVGIQPVNDGGLLAAGLFLSQKLRLQNRAKPRAYLETIAVSNWCKFSIKSDHNEDYITNIKKLTPSLPFVVGELALLQPAVVVVPKQLWRHPILRATMRGASPKTKFIPAPQFNASVVNCHLGKYDRPAAKLKRELKDTPLASWMENLRGMNKNHAWRYIAMLDKVT